MWPLLTTARTVDQMVRQPFYSNNRSLRSLALGQLPSPKHSPRCSPTAEAERGPKDPWVQKENGQKEVWGPGSSHFQVTDLSPQCPTLA